MSSRERDISRGGELPPGVLAIGQSDLADLVFRALQLKGALPGELDRRFQLGITVDDWTAMEFRWLKRASTWDAVGVAAAVAAQLPWVQLVGVANRLTVIEKLRLNNNSGAAMTLQVGISGTLLGGGASTATAFPDDERYLTARPSTVVTGGSVVGPAGVLGQNITVPNASAVEVLGPWVLAGGVGVLSVVGQTPNVSFSCGVRFWERVQLASEL